MAQAPILSRVSRSRPQRSICAGVPLFMMVPPARPVLTPERGDDARAVVAQLDDRDERHGGVAAALGALGRRRARQLALELARLKQSRASASSPKVR